MTLQSCFFFFSSLFVSLHHNNRDTTLQQKLSGFFQRACQETFLLLTESSLFAYRKEFTGKSGVLCEAEQSVPGVNTKERDTKTSAEFLKMFSLSRQRQSSSVLFISLTLLHIHIYSWSSLLQNSADINNEYPARVSAFCKFFALRSEVKSSVFSLWVSDDRHTFIFSCYCTIS